MSLGLVKNHNLEVWKKYVPALKREENNSLSLSSSRRNERMSMCPLKMLGKLMDPLNAVSL